MATTLKDITRSAVRTPLSVQGIVANADTNSGVNDTARSPESVESSNIVIPADQLGTSNTAIPNFNPAPAPNKMADQLEAIKQQAFQIQSALPQTATETATASAEPLDFKGQIQENLAGMFNTDIAGESQDIRDRFGLAEKEKLARDLNNEATSIKRDYEARIREARSNPDGKLKGALQMELDDIAYDGNLLLSEKMFQYSIANGDFQQAEKLALQTISDMEKRDQRQLQLLQTAWNFVQNDLSESEKLQITQEFESQQAERDFERSQYMAEFNYSLGAGQRAFDNRMAQGRLALSQAQYQASLNTVIDRGDGNKQLINKVTGDVIATYGEGGLEGVQPFDDPQIKAKAQDQVNDVAQLAYDKGLNNAVGANPFARWSTPFSGDKEAFVGKVENMVDTLTLMTYAEAKAQGLTFGAMSEGEWNILAKSATAIGNWRLKDKETGKVTGYDVGQKAFKKELDTLTQYAKIGYINKGGDPAEVGVQVMSDGSYHTLNSDGTVTEIITNR